VASHRLLTSHDGSRSAEQVRPELMKYPPPPILNVSIQRKRKNCVRI
jgi:hypothetical protein